MAVEIRVPALGESVVEATVGQWSKAEGDAVQKDEILVELETDKITVEVSAPQDGVLGSIARREGEVVGIDDLLGTLSAGEVGNGAGSGTSAAASGAGSGSGSASEQADAAVAGQPASGQPSSTSEGAQTSPAARSIAAENGIDLSTVTGSGPNGRVTKEDVLKAVEVGGGSAPSAAGESAPASAPPAPTPPPRAPEATRAPSAPKAPPATGAPASSDGREDRQRMSRRRQTIARRLVEAQQGSASLTTFNEVDLSRVSELRKRRQEDFVKKNGLKLGFMSFFTKATVGALKQFPFLNAEIQGDEFVLKNYYDIGIAVGTDEGLVVPVLRDADRKSFAEIERGIGELAVKARDGKLTLDELQGGSFTITNGGIYGSMLSTPILNTPQVGILGMHNIIERPVAVNGQVEIRPMMYVALTYDHRIVDGSVAVRFLVAIKKMIEDPETMLLEG